MQKIFLGLLLLILLVVLLALRNAQMVQLDLWVWQVETSFSLIIIIAVTFGALASFFLSLPDRINKDKRIREKDEKITFLEKEIISLGKISGRPTEEQKQDSQIIKDEQSKKG